MRLSLYYIYIKSNTIYNFNCVWLFCSFKVVLSSLSYMQNKHMLNLKNPTRLHFVVTIFQLNIKTRVQHRPTVFFLQFRWYYSCWGTTFAYHLFMINELHRRQCRKRKKMLVCLKTQDVLKVGESVDGAGDSPSRRCFRQITINPFSATHCFLLIYRETELPTLETKTCSQLQIVDKSILYCCWYK